MFVDTFFVALQCVGLVLLADFLGGLFHWAEDTYGSEDTPLWGRLFVKPNKRHHHHPTEMIKIHWLRNNTIIFVFCGCLTVVFWALGIASWQFFVFLAAAICNQQVHRFAHTPRHKLPRLVRLLQRARIIQNARHHWQHHTSPNDDRYCVLTPWVNPVLDQTRFWRGLEWLLSPALGKPRQSEIQR